MSLPHIYLNVHFSLYCICSNSIAIFLITDCICTVTSISYRLLRRLHVPTVTVLHLRFRSKTLSIIDVVGYSRFRSFWTPLTQKMFLRCRSLTLSVICVVGQTRCRSFTCSPPMVGKQLTH